jgi:hypothetical protein
MNIETNDKVTLSLEKYEEMKAELSQLRKLVQEKEIVKYYPHPFMAYSLMIVFVILLFGVGLLTRF